MKSIYRILRAFVMAAWGHRRQRDKAGERYIWHLVRVAWIAYGLQPSVNVVVVALLHDYLEDIDGDAAMRLIDIFGFQVGLSVMDITHDKHTTYPEYIRFILIFGSGYAQIVKLADLLDNTRPGRMPRARTSDERDERQDRGGQYLDAIEALTRRRVMLSWGVE